MWGVADAAHAETDSDAKDPVIAPLSCSLVEVTSPVRFTSGSRLAAIYGASEAVEGYHCRYGLAAPYAARLGADESYERRLDERRDLWRRFLASYGLEAILLDAEEPA